MKRVPLVIAAVVALLVLSKSLYLIYENEQVIITQFGEVVAAVQDPGLHFRLPFVQEVNRLEKRLLPWDGDPENMPTKDKNRIYIYVWARWRIVAPQQFFQAVRTIPAGQRILDDLVDSAVRVVIARYNLIECVRSTNDTLRYGDEVTADQAPAQESVTAGRGTLEKEILAAVNASDLKTTYGMEIKDVHIKRVSYIDNVRDRVYERMKSERSRIAKLFESEAEEERNRILGTTRRDLDEIEGDMERAAAEIRGQADAEVIRIYADALGQDLEFFDFLRRLEAYKNTLKAGARLVLSTDNEFLRLLRSPENTKP